MATGEIVYIRRVANENDPPNRIMELMELAGLNQRQLASLAHCDPATINKLIKGDRGLDQHWMRRLAPLLGVTPAELLPVEDNPFLLSEEERQLIERLRASDRQTRDTFERVSDAVLPFAHRPDEDEAKRA